MGKIILLVDDDATNRLLLSTLLDEDGFHTDLASSFKEASAKIAATSGHYDVVLLDQHLGDGLGTDLIPSIRGRHKQAKIILISGSIEKGKATTVGADGVATKGISFPDLVAIIERTTK